MSADRNRVRALVRSELEKRLHASTDLAPVGVAALLEIHSGPECNEDPDFPTRKPCVIEPDRSCVNTGYCKKLGY